MDIEDLKDTLADNAVKIRKLEKQVEELLDTQYRRDEWLRKAKAEAGYHNNVSFDIVWKEVLEKSRGK